MLINNRHYCRLAYLRVFWSLSAYHANICSNNILVQKEFVNNISCLTCYNNNSSREEKHNGKLNVFLRLRVMYEVVVSKCVTVGTLGFVFEKTFSMFRIGWISLETILICGVNLTLRFTACVGSVLEEPSVDISELTSVVDERKIGNKVGESSSNGAEQPSFFRKW